MEAKEYVEIRLKMEKWIVKYGKILETMRVSELIDFVEGYAKQSTPLAPTEGEIGYPYECTIIETNEKFIPTIIDFDNRQFWRQMGQASENGVWYSFDEVIYKLSYSPAPTDEEIRKLEITEAYNAGKSDMYHKQPRAAIHYYNDIPHPRPASTDEEKCPKCNAQKPKHKELCYGCNTLTDPPAHEDG
jgi:hypothetical protein